MQTFNPKRLEFALKKRGLTQTSLAQKLGVTDRQVRNYIKNAQFPELHELSRVLNFPISFFVDERELPEIENQAVSFRARTRTPKKLQNQAKSHCVTAFLFNDWLQEEFNLAPSSIPDLSDKEPEEAALTLRLEWGLGYEPIQNMISLLESKGVRVFSLSLETKDIDAFCTWNNNQPFVFLNTQKSSERSRFDAAHELGHLVRDQYNMTHYISDLNENEPRDIIEKNANLFAAAFLMPEQALLKYRSVPMTIENLMKIKKHFGVSLVALAYRMHQLKMITDWMYIHVLCPQIAKAGYRVNEPSPIPRESSSALKQILNMLKEDGISIEQIAEQIQVSANDIASLAFELVNTDIDRYSKLRLVK